MRAITMYEAEDGTAWRKPDDAIHRDGLVAQCREVVRALGMHGTPDGVGFGNGNGYVQQPKGTRDALIHALKAMGAHRDSDGPVGDLLHRAWRIDEQDREWGQVYYANNPDQGQQVDLTPPTTR